MGPLREIHELLAAMEEHTRHTALAAGDLVTAAEEMVRMLDEQRRGEDGDNQTPRRDRA
jgi:hypothetical protein